ncbi:MAG: uroporphyrinogen decarboxylase family protein [Anaerolineae bacterium]
MTKKARLQAAIKGEAVDRIPIAFWRHFPGDDQRADDLAKAIIAFQRRFDFDFVKVTPSSSFTVEDWGVKAVYRGNQEGTREYTERRVKSPEDWHRLEPLDVTKGALGRQLNCLRLLKQEFKDEVPFIQTIFNPLAVARYLRGDRFLVDMRTHPDALHAGLEVITDTLARFIKEVTNTGAAGIFLAVQHATYRLLSEGEYREFGIKYDLAALNAATGSWFNVLHIHGDDIMFDLLNDYPVQAVNWHDRSTSPSLAEAKGRFAGALIGGIKQWETLLTGDPEDVEGEVRDAIAQTEGRGLIIGAGCVIPVTAPEGNIWAAKRAAVRK